MTQRIIKFRAWDGIKMFYEVFHHLGFAGETLKEKAEIGINDAIAVTQKIYILMQFTGLLDKNGKEIYEGDVVKGIGKPFVVVWLNGGFACDNGADMKPKLPDILELYQEGCEIVGNIYENPNLLTQ